MNEKVEREFLSADLARLESLLSNLSESSILTRMGLESRRDELREALASIDTVRHPLASVALFFSGKPVANGRGIESRFGSDVLARFQDIVSDVFAARHVGMLGQRGPVSGKDRSKLHITNIVRGSFGFQLEEVGDQPLFDSNLKDSVEQTAKIIASFDDADEDVFGEAIEDLDGRILEHVKSLFEIIQSGGATFRIVSGSIVKRFDETALQRAASRAKLTSIGERSAEIAGILLGILPEQRTFEYRTETGETLRGKVEMELPTDDLSRLNRDWVQQDSRATFRVRDISRVNTVYRHVYFLTGIQGR